MLLCGIEYYLRGRILHKNAAFPCTSLSFKPFDLRRAACFFVGAIPESLHVAERAHCSEELRYRCVAKTGDEPRVRSMKRNLTDDVALR